MMQQMVLALLLLPAVFYFGLLARVLHRYTFYSAFFFFASEILSSVYFVCLGGELPKVSIA